MELIKSVMNNDRDILEAISILYLGGKFFDVDSTYSKGIFYKDLPKPKYKFDLNPQVDDVIKWDVKELSKYPFKDRIKSIVFDPPFMFGKHGKTDENIMAKRFTMFDSWEDLKETYQKSLQEFYKILVKGGIVAFKCQDYTDNKTTLTHSFVIQWGIDVGFKTEDLFIKVTNTGRIYNPKVKQRHARKFHSYWIVFKK